MSDTDKLVEYLEPLITRNSALISNSNVVLLEHALCEIMNKDKKNYSTIIVDSPEKLQFWGAACHNKTELDLKSIEEISSIEYCGYNLLLDIEKDNYTDEVIESIKNGVSPYIWMINNNLGDKAIIFMGALSFDYKIIKLDSDILFKNGIIDSPKEDDFIYLVSRKLPDSGESEQIEYYTGIPIDIQTGSYNEFIPAFAGNAKSLLAITAADKYDYLERRQKFYLSKFKDIVTAKSKNTSKFITERCKEASVELKNFINKYRIILM